MRHVSIIDSHTGGEPTRVVIDGGPDLGSGSLAVQRERFRAEHDAFRRAVILEPRGSDVLVGALLCEPDEPGCAAGTIFFNNVDCLNMCGHGTIGLAVTLARLGRIAAGRHKLDTPVGVVPFELLDAHRVRLENVPSYRHDTVAVEIPEYGPITGDVAWGGNWFFIAPSPIPLEFANVPALTAATLAVRAALEARGVTGAENGLIDHVEFYAPSPAEGVDARNFVMCPGGAYDRSPCGTGTSAKVACLAANGELAPGQTWVQESIIGSRFEASYAEAGDGRVIPSITGSAYVHGEGALLLDPDDPFVHGIA